MPKKKAIINFKKAKGLIDRIIKMVEDDEYCIDIMQQNLAAIGLLRSAHRMLMENHLNSCFRNAILSRNAKKQKEMIKEILDVARLFNR